MRRNQFMASILSVAILSASIFTGCSGSSASPDATATNENQAAPTKEKEAEEKKDEKVEITFWNYPNYQVIDGLPGKYEEGLVAAFNEKYPNIKVNVEMLSFDGGPEKLSAAIASNSQPDLVYDYPGRIIDYARQGVMAPVDSMLQEADIKDIPESILNACKLDGKTYMYPINTAPFMLGVNKTFVEKNGLIDMLPLDDPLRKWTIDEFTEFLRAVKKVAPADVSPMTWFSKSQGGDQGTRAFVSHIYGGSVVNEDMTQYTMNTPEAIKGLQWVVDGVSEGLIVPGSESYNSNDAMGLFLQEKAVVSALYSAVLKKTNASVKTGEWEDILMPLPVATEKDDPRLEAYIGGIGIFDNGDPAKVEAAKTFVDFLANDAEWGKKNLMATGGLSVRSSITNLYDDEESKFAEKMVPYIGNYYNAVPGFAEMRTYWFPEVQNATLKAKTPEEALNSFVEKANETLAKK
ncbi:MAG: transporter substrate-binding protein [Clostridia bacterium]|nr:transporter substrate-binding protein [Clostridia bacterium]